MNLIRKIIYSLLNKNYYILISFLCFCKHLVFWKHFKELQTVLFEVELIINNAPLTYVYAVYG